MKTIWLAVAMLLLGGCAHVPAREAGNFAAGIADHARAHEFSGTVMVQHHGRNAFARSYGMADRAFEVPADNATRYRIASITKLFTAVMILQLHDEGRIDLNAPIRTYIENYPGQGGDRVTVHQLLNHTSGIAQFDRVASLEQALVEGIEQYQRPQTPAQLLDRCCSGALVREPGAAFDYNNADYIVLGQIIERVTGSSYEEALGARILRPLGLQNTGVARQEAIIPRLAPTYYWREDRQAWMNDLPGYFQNWGPAGAMYSTASDLIAFADALYGGRLLRPETLARMLTPGLDDYGYGLWSYSFERGGRRHRVAKRPGRIMGANAVLYRLLDDDATIVILANTNRADLDIFAQHIADLLVGRGGS